METWKAIPGFEGSYEISRDGRVKNARSGFVLNPYWRGGYRSVSLKVNGKVKMRFVHNLVLEVFVGKRPSGLFGAHMDGDRENNTAGNLSWVTQAENEGHKILHGSDMRGEKSRLSKLSNEQANIVREIVAAGISQTKVARLLGMAESSISRIISNARYV